MAYLGMKGVREYNEEMEVELNDGERPTVKAYNEGGYNSTEIDLIDIIEWTRVNRPNLLKEIKC